MASVAQEFNMRRKGGNTKFGLSTHSWKNVDCSTCGKPVGKVDSEVVSAVCFRCSVHYGGRVAVAQEKESSGFPRGWKLYKQFVHTDGRVFINGEENTALKGTLKPTVVTVKPKLSKYQKELKRQEKDKKLADKYARKMEKKSKIKQAKEKAELKEHSSVKESVVHQFFE